MRRNRQLSDPVRSTPEVGHSETNPALRKKRGTTQGPVLIRETSDVVADSYVESISVANLSEAYPYFIVFPLKRSVAFAHRRRAALCASDDSSRRVKPSFPHFGNEELSFAPSSCGPTCGPIEAGFLG